VLHILTILIVGFSTGLTTFALLENRTLDLSNRPGHMQVCKQIGVKMQQEPPCFGMVLACDPVCQPGPHKSSWQRVGESTFPCSGQENCYNTRCKIRIHLKPGCMDSFKEIEENFERKVCRFTARS
jgi:hypothetical protein